MHMSDIPIDWQEEKGPVWGHGGPELLDPHSSGKCVLS